MGFLFTLLITDNNINSVSSLILIDLNNNVKLLNRVIIELNNVIINYRMVKWHGTSVEWFIVH